MDNGNAPARKDARAITTLRASSRNNPSNILNPLIQLEK